jgi:hypothetical protein
LFAAVAGDFHLLIGDFGIIFVRRIIRVRVEIFVFFDVFVTVRSFSEFFFVLLLQCDFILVGDLIIVWVNFRKGEEAVAIATIVDKGRLQRRLYARDFGEIDIAAQLTLSKSNSSTRVPSTMTTRVSSGWAASINIRFVMGFSCGPEIYLLRLTTA